MNANTAVRAGATFIGIFFAFGLFLIVNLVSQGVLSNLDNPKTYAQAAIEKANMQTTAQRIAPVGKTDMAGIDKKSMATMAPVAKVEKSGEQVYSAICIACHGSGVLGAPKKGDTAAWDARMSVGMDAIVTSAINGKGSMPPKGGDASLSTNEIKAAIEFMNH
jgi:cytochrome c5